MASEQTFSEWYFAYCQANNRTPSMEEVWNAARPTQTPAATEAPSEPVPSCEHGCNGCENCIDDDRDADDATEAPSEPDAASSISLKFATEQAMSVLDEVLMYGGEDLGPSVITQVKDAIEFCERALATPAPAAPASVQPVQTSLSDERPPIKWPKARDVGRLEDMSPDGVLRVGLDNDGDAYVSVWTERGGGVEFCTSGNGGGRSPRTREALLALMVAMEADNAQDPRRDWWAQRNLASSTPAKGGQTS